MTQTIHIKMMEQKIEFDLPEDNITKTSIKSALLLSEDSIVSLSYEVDGRKKYCRVSENGKIFLLPENWTTLMFVAQTDKARSRPATSIDVDLYPEAPSPPPPLSKSIDEWMFYTKNSAGKATVTCVHPRYFVTFRHGTHLLLEVGSKMKIFHAKEDDDANPEKGFDVVVVDINERMDFILLKSKESIVKRPPHLARGGDSEKFLFAGFGDGCQELTYSNGMVDSFQGHYFSVNDGPLMGPFLMGTGQSSTGYSGDNFKCLRMEKKLFFNFNEKANSPKYIISPAVFIEQSLMKQLRIEQENYPKFPPKNSRLLETYVEGIGLQTLFIDEEGL